MSGFRDKSLVRKISTFLKYSVFSLGIIFFVLIFFAFTRVPYDLHRWLGSHGSQYKFQPDYVIFLGGSGMPSESNLMRLYYTVRLAQRFPGSRIILVHPIDTTVIQSMKEELLVHQIDSSRILTESEGTNTREQALRIAGMDSGLVKSPVVIVTSPENMYRTVRVFRRAGFESVGGEPAFENAMFVDLGYNHLHIGGKKYVPDVSEDMALRYNFWNYLKLEVTCIREYVAILYYQLNGWI